tara:strand:- start:116 stop:262 length:147 start_codon:yes stop_codon:yes gene_type:complete
MKPAMTVMVLMQMIARLSARHRDAVMVTISLATRNNVTTEMLMKPIPA